MMQFVRENIMLISLAVFVAVAGTIILAVNFNIAAKVDDELDQRRVVASDLKRLMREKKVNTDVVKAQQDRVETVRSAVEDVIDSSIEWNRRNFHVLQLTADDGKVVPAFPIDSRLYSDYSLTFVFTEQYGQQVRSLLKRLNPTSLPNAEEIEKEKAQWLAKLTAERDRAERIRRRREGNLTPAAPAAPMPPMPGMPGMLPMPGARAMPMPAGRFGAAPAGAGTDISKKAAAIAVDTLKLKKAREGTIYASADSFDIVFPTAVANASDSQIWEAQLNLWITSEIVEAIIETNRQVLSAASDEAVQRNVTTAAVKQLVKIDIDENYVTGVARAAGGARPTPGAPAMPPGFMGGPGGPGPGWGGPGFPAGPGFAAPPGVARKPSTGSDNLTERISTKQYDVIHYNFTVIMPSKHVLSLERNLLRRNYHTILAVEMSEVPPDQNTLYYYGTDPVMEVTISGELLLRTDWERGKWDEKENDWSQKYPALMPLEVLRVQLGNLTSALRPEDKRRLTPLGIGR